MDLIEQLTAAMDETERIARAASKPPWTGEGKIVLDADFHEVADDAGWTGMDEDDVAHIVHNDPKRVLDRVAADREILAEHQPWEPEPGKVVCGTCSDYDYMTSEYTGEWPCKTLPALAKGYGIDVSGSTRVAEIVEQEGMEY